MTAAKKTAMNAQPRQSEFRRWLSIYAIVWLPIALAYFAILFTTPQIGGARVAASVFSNVLFPFTFGLAVYGVMLRWLVRERFWIQALAHAIGSLAFTVLWALALFRALQFVRGLTIDDWSYVNFTGPALLWQLFQGVTIYYMIAAGTYAVWFYDQLQAIRAARETPRPDLSGARTNILGRFFARSGDDIFPVDFDDVVSIHGADDYAEIHTPSGNHLTRLTLRDLESKLDAAKFIRVHRSCIVNIDKIKSMEPAGGGRFSIHMSGGATIVASRAGAQKLRERLI